MSADTWNGLWLAIKEESDGTSVKASRARQLSVARNSWSKASYDSMNAFHPAYAGPGSVLVLDSEEGAADGSGQLRLLPRELEPRREFRGDFHPFGELEPDRPLPRVVDGVHHVDRQAALVEDVGHPDVLDLEGRSLQRAGRDDDVAFFLEDPVHPVDGRLGVARWLHREDMVVPVLEVAGLVRPQASERGCDWRRFQAGGRDGGEIHGVGHDVLPNAPRYVRLLGRIVPQRASSMRSVMDSSRVDHWR